MAELSRTRIVLMSICIAGAYIVWGLLLSIQPSFYPIEAEKKGATPSQYGFVFGIANLAAFLSAPIFGRFGPKIGAKVLYNCGAFLQGICGLCFGFLSYCQDPNVFIGLSYLLRFLGGMADVAAWGAVLSIMMKLFPDKVARIVSLTEMFFGLGYMLGPAIGAFLYEIGGFKLPFFAVGAFGMVVATCLLFVIPNVKIEERRSNAKSLNYSEVVRNPSLFMPFVDNFCCLFVYGMISSMLATHLNEAGASTNAVGVTFLVQGAIFMATTPIVGLVCDKIGYPSMVSVFGNFVLVIAFIFIGPLPSLDLEPSYASITSSTALVAFGYECVMVSTFSRAQAAAIRMGFEKDLDTYLLISGMWSTTFYLGCFLGPTIAGFVVEAKGFRFSTIPSFILLIIILLVDLVELAYNVKMKRSTKNINYEEMQTLLEK